jgi:DNA-binding transcriptional LysR family regulator
VNIRSIRAFVEVARRRSVSEAAASLGYSQSAISKQVAEFERGVGSRVFHRDCAGLPLTACGERLLPLAVQVMSLVDALGRGEPAVRWSTDTTGSSGETVPRSFV